MSYGNEENNVMSQMFSGRLKIYKRDLDLAERGYGKGVGHLYGSYALYVKQLRDNANIRNGAVSIGRDINLNTATPTMTDPTVEFAIGEIPKILIEFHGLINELFVNATWKYIGSEDIILKSSYRIPSPYGENYDWWDLYSVYFVGPENLGEGEYNVILEAEDIKKNKLISTVEFSVSDAYVSTPNNLVSLQQRKDNLTSLRCEKIAYVENER